MSLSKSETAHRTAGLVYCLWLLGILFGITAIIGAYINHTKLASTRGTHAYSHFIWQIASFWTVFVGALISVILWPSSAAKFIAFSSFAIWLFSGMIGCWYWTKAKKLNFFSRKSRNMRHNLQPRHEIHDAENT